jgi:hypothetical protein
MYLASQYWVSGILVTLIDPNILQDFAADNDYFTWSVASSNSVAGQLFGSSDQGDRGDQGGFAGQWAVPWGTFSEPMHPQIGILWIGWRSIHDISEERGCRRWAGKSIKEVLEAINVSRQGLLYLSKPTVATSL